VACAYAPLCRPAKRPRMRRDTQGTRGAALTLTQSDVPQLEHVACPVCAACMPQQVRHVCLGS
jgi:hypothetical protein